jgi:hypothetical protein
LLLLVCQSAERVARSVHSVGRLITKTVAVAFLFQFAISRCFDSPVLANNSAAAAFQLSVFCALPAASAAAFALAPCNAILAHSSSEACVGFSAKARKCKPPLACTTTAPLTRAAATPNLLHSRGLEHGFHCRKTTLIQFFINYVEKKRTPIFVALKQHRRTKDK